MILLCQLLGEEVTTLAESVRSTGIFLSWRDKHGRVAGAWWTVEPLGQASAKDPDHDCLSEGWLMWSAEKGDGMVTSRWSYSNRTFLSFECVCLSFLFFLPLSFALSDPLSSFFLYSLLFYLPFPSSPLPAMYVYLLFSPTIPPPLSILAALPLSCLSPLPSISSFFTSQLSSSFIFLSASVSVSLPPRETNCYSLTFPWTKSSAIHDTLGNGCCNLFPWLQHPQQLNIILRPTSESFQLSCLEITHYAAGGNWYHHHWWFSEKYSHPPVAAALQNSQGCRSQSQ